MIKESISNLEAIFWDFDGVIMDSNKIRDRGFIEVLKEFPGNEVSQLMEFHNKNGGLSRYVKFRYFFEQIRGGSISDDEINQWANKFSEIMRNLLVNPSLLFDETLDFIKANHSVLPMHIVSGSDQEELRYLCEAMEIKKFFQRIHGSPTAKMEWLSEIIISERYVPNKCVMIGDSINDYEAAMHSNAQFMAYNNPDIEHLSSIELNFK